ncbi:sensor histidine kinase [Streptomyces scabiei]|uniref:sensor histidine kinase n=1 Tax=Streptomyces scabiei TaxID=1930 RepID=UPI0038F7D0CB
MRMPRSRPIVVDTLMALVMVCVAVLLGQESVAQGWPELDVHAYPMLALVYLPLVLRSRAPLVVFATVQCLTAAYISLGYWPLLSVFGTALALYTVASARPTRIAIACMAVMTVNWVYGGVISAGRSPALAVSRGLLYCIVLMWFGVLARRSRELSQQLRVEQEKRAHREVAAERGRIARELHDVVAHHMSVISVQAGLARFVFDSDAVMARGALSTIEETSGEALEELRRMLYVLRENERGNSDSAAPMPTLDRIGDLVERVRAGGVPVELSIAGSVRPLAPGVELCAYRVVQEALTNVLKHTRHAAAEVRLHYRRHHLAVSVVDGGEVAVSGNTPLGGGHGLIGMRERVMLYGGTISVGPRPEGGFEVRVTLPTSETRTRREDE